MDIKLLVHERLTKFLCTILSPGRNDNNSHDHRKHIKDYKAEIDNNLLRIESNSECATYLQKIATDIYKVVSLIPEFEKLGEANLDLGYHYNLIDIPEIQIYEWYNVQVELTRSPVISYKQGKSLTKKQLSYLKNYRYDSSSLTVDDPIRQELYYKIYASTVIQVLSHIDDSFAKVPIGSIENLTLNNKRWLTQKEAERYTGLKRTSLYNLRKEGKIDATTKGKVLYDRESIDEYYSM